MRSFDPQWPPMEQHSAQAPQGISGGKSVRLYITVHLLYTVVYIGSLLQSFVQFPLLTSHRQF
jgi:hypothetical protein